MIPVIRVKLADAVELLSDLDALMERADARSRRGTRLAVGGRGALSSADATRSDVLLVGKAINNHWPVPMHQRRPIIEDLMQLLDTGPVRLRLRVVSTLIFADRGNLRAEAAERAAANIRR
jgi:hypothetical protein